ncbi:hypothetical protein O9929_25475 [Vibrio lentus]|nr:hypothetical protein [Vibrio lentus]
MQAFALSVISKAAEVVATNRDEIGDPGSLRARLNTMLEGFNIATTDVLRWWDYRKKNRSQMVIETVQHSLWWWMRAMYPSCERSYSGLLNALGSLS